MDPHPVLRSPIAAAAVGAAVPDITLTADQAVAPVATPVPGRATFTG